jgi:lariat debranching enzyme
MESANPLIMEYKELIVAVEGCCHGELDNIYETIRISEEKMSKKVDLLIICGDFQALRNNTDMNNMAVPDKFKHIGTFHKYYSGKYIAPVLTIFIGGNHEASNYAQELPYGGWVAKNIYYMGYASVLNFGGLRIAGISGIYNKHHYQKGHFEKAPYDNNEIRSVYHMRQIEIFKFLQLSGKIDIFISHDWPLNIHNYGNAQELIRMKPFFEKEINEGSLGNPATEKLLHILQPNYWFSAHLHVKFAALVNFEENKSTKFLALDKCLPNRDFLQILTLPVVKTQEPKVLKYDLEWLSILRSMDYIDSMTYGFVHIPNSEQTDIRSNFNPTDEEKDSTMKLFPNGLEILDNFLITAVAYPETSSPNEGIESPQTKAFCETLGIKNYVLNCIMKGDTNITDCHEEIKIAEDLFC